MQQGNTFNVSLNPIGAKQLDSSETIVPAHLELRNGVRTDAGFFKSRPGYTDEWNIGVAVATNGLIPFKRASTSGLGFAVTTTGRIFELRPSQVEVEYTGTTLTGAERPYWVFFNDGTNTMPIVINGQAPIRIRTDLAGLNTLDVLPGSPPAGKWLAVVADRLVIAGQNETQFNWSAPGSAISWPANNFSNVTGHGEGIRYMTARDTDLYFFKDASIELWSHIGGNEVFGRRAIVNFMDKFAVNRGLVGATVVQAGNPSTFFFYADGDFWAMSGFNPVRISGNYKREIGNLASVSGMYGFHYDKEHVIRWFEPVSGKCFNFDYVNQNFVEDNKWLAGDWARLPHFSYMESDGVAYFGDFDPTGKIYRWSDTIFRDDGAEIRVFRKFRVLLDPQTNHRVRWNRMRLRFKRGQGAIGSNPLLNVRWALDGVDFNANQSLAMGEATASVGEAGNYDPTLDLLNLGVGREAIIEMFQTANVQHLLTHCTVTAKPLGR
jgi:hypothetical protein